MSAPLPGTAATPQGFRSRIRHVGEPVALFFGRIGLTPNALTLLGFLITVAGAALAAVGLWLAAGIVVFLGGVFDMFDGALARATGRASKLGAFLDSVFDRWGEAVVYVGIVVGCLGVGVQPRRRPGRVRDGRGIPGQLRPGQSEGLGFSRAAAWRPWGLPRARSASSSSASAC